MSPVSCMISGVNTHKRDHVSERGRVAADDDRSRSRSGCMMRDAQRGVVGVSVAKSGVQGGGRI
jgi:hypothetical protein